MPIQSLRGSLPSFHFWDAALCYSGSLKRVSITGFTCFARCGEKFSQTLLASQIEQRGPCRGISVQGAVNAVFVSFVDQPTVEIQRSWFRARVCYHRVGLPKNWSLYLAIAVSLLCRWQQRRFRTSLSRGSVFLRNNAMSVTLRKIPPFDCSSLSRQKNI